MTSVAKEKSEICHISFTFPITVTYENFKKGCIKKLAKIPGFMVTFSDLKIKILFTDSIQLILDSLTMLYMILV
jgi:hypothetical protein